MPSGTEFTFRAKMPAATPAINPLIVEPNMIAPSCALTAGVNHADPPSIAPSTAPIKSPSSTLFIAILRSNSLFLLFCTTNPGIPLGLPVQQKQNQDAHHQIGCNQQDKETVAPVEAGCSFEKALAMGIDGQSI